MTRARALPRRQGFLLALVGIALYKRHKYLALSQGEAWGDDVWDAEHFRYLGKQYAAGSALGTSATTAIAAAQYLR